MIRTICLVAVLFVAEDISCRSISKPSEFLELPSSDQGENHEHFNDVLKRDKKSYLSTPFVRELNSRQIMIFCFICFN